MRIAHCIHGLGLGGAQKVLETLVTSLKVEDYQHFVYCSLDGPVRTGVEKAGATVRLIPRLLPKIDPFWAYRLATTMRSDGVDLVHTHLFGDSLHGFLAGLFSGLPVVMTLHNNQARFNFLQQFGYRWMLPRCAAVVACAPSVMRSFVEDQPSLAQKIEVIPNGIEFEEQGRLSPEEESELRTELGIEPQTLIFIAMGRFVKQKGYKYLIQAFSQLPEPLKNRSQLLLLGQGPLESELKSLTSSLRVSRTVLFPGYRQDVRRILGISDAVVFSSLWEGLPIALLEAMAAGRSIVATDIEAFVDALEPGVEALLVPPADSPAMAAALETLIEDELMKDELGRRARVRFAAEFTAPRMVDAYEQLYRKVLSRTLRSKQED